MTDTEEFETARSELLYQTSQKTARRLRDHPEPGTLWAVLAEVQANVQSGYVAHNMVGLGKLEACIEWARDRTIEYGDNQQGTQPHD